MDQEGKKSVQWKTIRYYQILSDTQKMSWNDPLMFHGRFAVTTVQTATERVGFAHFRGASLRFALSYCYANDWFIAKLAANSCDVGSLLCFAALRSSTTGNGKDISRTKTVAKRISGRCPTLAYAGRLVWKTMQRAWKSRSPPTSNALVEFDLCPICFTAAIAVANGIPGFQCALCWVAYPHDQQASHWFFIFDIWNRCQALLVLFRTYVKRTFAVTDCHNPHSSL